MSDTKNVKLGVCRAYYDGQDLGYTKGGVEVSVTTETHKVEVDQFGKAPINENIIGRNVVVKIPLAETTLENLVKIMPGSTLVTNGVKASGTITIATNPTANQTVVVNGKTVTFKALAAADGEVTIGATAAATAANLAAALNASTDTLVSAASFTVVGAIVTMTADFTGVAGNAMTLAAGTAGVAVTLSGATLTGGTAATKARVDVTSGVGIDLLSIAKVLRLHPKGKPDTDTSDDFVVPLAATPGALTYAYKLEDERIFNVEFSGYPDPTNEKLFYVGDEVVV